LKKPKDPKTSAAAKAKSGKQKPKVKTKTASVKRIANSDIGRRASSQNLKDSNPPAGGPKAPKFPKTPTTMEELMALDGFRVHGLKRGQIIEGVVVEKTKKILYIDIGGKSDAMVIDREMKAAEEYVKTLKVGDKVQAIVTQLENDRGQTLLSLKNAAQDSIWGEFEKLLESGKMTRVRGKEVNPGGLIVMARGLQGFVPSSQFGEERAEKIKELVNQEIEVKVIEVDREKNRLIFSEREVSEAGMIEAQKQALKGVKNGQVFDGEVVGIMPFGLFVRVEVTKETKGEEGVFLEGLVHISEISWEKVDDPKTYYKEGDKVKVQVLAIDEKSGKLNLSVKQLLDDPWEEIEKKYPVEGRVKGEVVRLAPFGVFVQLEPGIEGLIHLSKIPSDKSLKEGDSVACFVESLDKKNRRLSLGLVLTQKPVGYK
jgi:small subunit ribosomal protein S1